MHLFFFCLNKKWVVGATNMAILPERDHSSILPVKVQTLPGCRETGES